MRKDKETAAENLPNDQKHREERPFIEIGALRAPTVCRNEETNDQKKESDGNSAMKKIKV
ncbi:hypothetical protein ATW55_04425 [Ferroacidibacillus organovorans]|uniref:Uncharacterized protein n=1 Tax=Ferroacidibacillus organovorans TaxID=1765683 RepID=A0A101XQ02_9BACL|nr:hypothetical protein ATW55_04425 [Ferroacidibacillus organovorans]